MIGSIRKVQKEPVGAAAKFVTLKEQLLPILRRELGMALGTREPIGVALVIGTV